MDRMVRYARMILAVMLLRTVASDAFADIYTDDSGVTWTFTVANGEASLGGGTLSSLAVTNTIAGDLRIPSVLGGCPVTSIGKFAFCNCRDLRGVVVPDSVSNIGQYAFCGCSNLVDVVIPDAVAKIEQYAFYACASLGHITIPTSLTTVEAGIFRDCTTLAEVEIPLGVTSINASAFYGCRELSRCVIPDSVQRVGAYAFYGCDSLTSIVLPSQLDVIYDYSFFGCQSLKTVAMPEKLARIADSAFRDCISLECLSFPDGVTSIGQSAFLGCSNITNVAIRESVVVEDLSFKGCPGLADSNGFVSMNGVLFDYVGVDNNVVIPEGIVKIGRAAFGYKKGLSNIAMSDTVKNIDAYAFDSCDATNIIVGCGVTNISAYAFSNCDRMRTVSVPNSVCTIGEAALWGCGSLEVMKVPFVGSCRTGSGEDGVLGCMFSRKNVVGTPYEGGENVSQIYNTRAGSCQTWAFSIPKSLREIVVTDASELKCGAFSNCTNINRVIVLESVSNIDKMAFYGCCGLQELYLPVAFEGTVSYVSAEKFVRYAPEQMVELHPEGGVVSLPLVDVWFMRPYGALPTPYREGYAFMGWYWDDHEINASSIVSALDSHELIARWQINEYLVAFEANGGKGGYSNSFAYAASLVAPVVTREGYSFIGWSPEVPATVPASNVTYTAQWQINQYNMTFDANGGVGGWSEACDYDSALVSPEVSRVGYTFTGWLPEVPATVPANDATYTAQWRINQYTVVLDANGGVGGTSGTQDYGTAIVAPSVTRTGYTFVGWAASDGGNGVAATVPAHDVTYVAQWEANTYTVTFDPNGGSLNGAASSKPVVFDAPYGELPVPMLEFCNFAGWTLGGVGVTEETTVATASDHALVAQWDRWGARIGASESGHSLRELYPDDYANLTDVVLEEGLKEIPAGFFDGCSSVVRLTLPESLETLALSDLPPTIRDSLDYGADGFLVYGGWVLGYCDDAVSSLVLPQGTVGIGTRAFAEFSHLESYLETVTIPDTVKHIGREAFLDCTYLDDVAIPDFVVTIASGAFDNCSYMQTLSVGSGVRKVADRAFARCASLQSVAFADGLESVGECAFSNDWRMLSVTLPHSVTNIGCGAFAKCSRVKGISVPTCVVTLAEMFPAAYEGIESCVVAAGEAEIMDSMFEGCVALSDFTWAGSETNVGARAFFGCKAMASVAMPDSVVGMGASAFAECSSMHDLTLSRSLAALPDYAFEKCGSLDSFIVPASVASLGIGFLYDSGVKAVYCLGNAPGYDGDAYAGGEADLVTYVVKGTRGWDGTPSSRVLPEDWIGHEITYWTPNRFDATFDANGGYFGESSVTQWAEEQITDMGYVLPNQNPVWPGYAFDGWWTLPEAGARVRYSTQVTATRPHTLYAHWRFLGELVVATFNSNGGTVVVPGSQSYVAGQTFGEFPVPSRRGYAFRGWWTASIGGERVTESSKVPAADIELFAHWEPVRYYVGYDANGGTGSMTNQVHVYDAAKALDPNRYSRTGFAFSGWARSGDGQVEYADCAEVVNLAETSNAVVMLYAVWSGAGYNVRFDANGGTGTMENQTIQIGETQNLHTNAFRYAGRVFVGWSLTSGGAVAYRDGETVCDLAETNGETVHLYAVWHSSDETYRVDFDANGGSVSPGHWNVARGESLDALPTPTRPGWTFDGWWTQAVGGTQVTVPFDAVADITLYAHWHDNADPLPPVSGDSGVVAILGDSADGRLAENIKTVEEYNALRAWADDNGIDHQAVRDSAHVWAAYLLGAERLFENGPKVEIGEVSIAAGGDGGGVATQFGVSVSVKDGEREVAVDAAKVAAMFEATSDLGDWSGEAKLAPVVTVVDSEGGGAAQGTDATGASLPMRFTVSLDGAAPRAFLRIRK